MFIIYTTIEFSAFPTFLVNGFFSINPITIFDRKRFSLDHLEGADHTPDIELHRLLSCIIKYYVRIITAIWPNQFKRTIEIVIETCEGSC